MWIIITWTIRCPCFSDVNIANESFIVMLIVFSCYYCVAHYWAMDSSLPYNDAMPYLLICRDHAPVRFTSTLSDVVYGLIYIAAERKRRPHRCHRRRRTAARCRPVCSLIGVQLFSLDLFRNGWWIWFLFLLCLFVKQQRKIKETKKGKKIFMFMICTKLFGQFETFCKD